MGGAGTCEDKTTTVYRILEKLKKMHLKDLDVDRAIKLILAIKT